MLTILKEKKLEAIQLIMKLGNSDIKNFTAIIQKEQKLQTNLSHEYRHKIPK